MTTADVDSGRTRQPLTRARVVDAAIHFADRHGLNELSMRKLGAYLGVEAMSLYHHVVDKADLQKAMLEEILAAITLPPDTGDWRTMIRDSCAAAIRELAAHRWVSDLRGPLGLEEPKGNTDWILNTLETAGLRHDQAIHSWHLLASHAAGHIVRNQFIDEWGGEYLFGLNVILDSIETTIEGNQ